MGVLSKIISIPTVSKMVLEILKKRAFKPYQISLEKALEKQNKMLEAKFKRMEGIEIGRKLGIRKGIKLQNLPETDYSFYEPFYINPSLSAFMYPLKEYIKVRTSGTAGKEKWFMLPEKAFVESFKQTAIQAILSLFHDGEKVTLEYGDNFYVNAAPRPFIGGILCSLASGKGGASFFNFVPNFNLSYHDKVQYFILNHEKIDAAAMIASTLISQIMPAIGKPIKLKGLFILDTTVGEIYKDEITKFTGTIPKTLYGSAETQICSIPSGAHSLAFLFDWRRGVYEFIPINGKVKEEKEFVTINEVKTGGIYQLIYTSFETELTRYNTKDVLICVADGDNTLGTDYPIFKFYGRLEKTISLQNFTRISEDELLTAFREAGIPFMDFTARAETEEGMQHLVIYMECPEDMTAKEIQEAMHKKLYEMDKDYRDLVDFFSYTPIKIRLVPRGIFAKYLEAKIATLPKVDRINMRQEEFEKLIQLMEKH